jgi:hypothetical protein
MTQESSDKKFREKIFKNDPELTGAYFPYTLKVQLENYFYAKANPSRHITSGPEFIRQQLEAIKICTMYYLSLYGNQFRAIDCNYAFPGLSNADKLIKDLQKRLESNINIFVTPECYCLVRKIDSLISEDGKIMNYRPILVKVNKNRRKSPKRKSAKRKSVRRR